jgi:small subunit ribosomal protein S9
LSTDDNERTPDEEEAAPDAESANAATEGQSGEQATRADSSPDASSDSEEAQEPVAEAPAPAQEPAAEPTSHSEAEGADAEAARAPSAQAPDASEDAPAASDAATTGESEPEEDYEEPIPREKPEIPGADLEPVFVAQEEQYLDAEAQAAAEAEAEAAAERARAEAEDEQARPIADAAIDLAAGARYTATGKRKTAVARVVLKPGGGEYSVNGKSLEAFFPRETLQRVIRQPLEAVGYEARMDVIARMHGGGVSAQAGALRHGISRALIEADPNLRGELKRRGYLTRDPRVKERKKAGLKKARKRPQFSKR